MSTTLEFRWTTSRARDTYGYNVCTLFVDGHKAARCNGGGYDMQGTCLGNWLAKAFADRLVALKPDDMPPNSHWEQAKNPRKVCRNLECILPEVEGGEVKIGYYPHDMENCPHCGKELDVDWHDGRRIDDGRYFYGLTFHDPNYDPGKAVIGEDCSNRTLGGEDGQTVEQAEAAGVSFGLERLQAAYSASSKHATPRHTVPLIDGACGFDCVRKIAEAIGLSLELVKGRRNRRDDIWILHDSRERVTA